MGNVHLYMKELTILIPMLTSLFLGKPIDVGQSDIVLIVSLVKKCLSGTGERKFQRE